MKLKNLLMITYFILQITKVVCEWLGSIGGC